jgi:hypothetical protein
MGWRRFVQAIVEAGDAGEDISPLIEEGYVHVLFIRQAGREVPPDEPVVLRSRGDIEQRLER